MHAGHVPVKDENENAELFFWLVRAQNYAKKRKLMIWLNGGPGCSSMDGMFLENGPFQVTENGAGLRVNPYSWTEWTDILYVDQPVETGFSFTNVRELTIPQNELEVVEHFLGFLDNFFTIFPELKRSDMYIAGESYAGQYVPYVASGMLGIGQIADRTGKAIYNVEGIAVGNGWMDPLRQYSQYLPFAKDNNLLAGKWLEDAERDWTRCEENYKRADPIKDDVCERIFNQVIDYSERDKAKGVYCLNIYDMRLRDQGPDDRCGLLKWPPSVPDVQVYLQKPEVVNALHVEKKKSKWEECNDPVLYALMRDASRPSYQLLPELLKNTKVLLFRWGHVVMSSIPYVTSKSAEQYSGAQDVICNWYGTRAMVDNLHWNGAQGMQESTNFNWHIDNRVIGTVQSARNLSFVVFHNGSHMVPVDEPVAALQMWNNFVGVKSVNMTLIDPSIKATPSGTQADPKKETHYYMAGTVLLVLLLMTMITCAILQWRKYFGDKTADGRPRVMEEGGVPSSGWQEVSGEDEDLFYNPDDGEEGHQLGPIAR
ncbi:Cell death protease [Rhizophlyctis rosea]|nr:Cell death protease [Rhizophlyctis rosea]